MSLECLVPRVAFQEKEGEKPRFLRGNEYEFYLKVYSKTSRVLLIPCGHCVNCIKRKSMEWTARLLKEMQNHKFAYFITLTLDDDHYHDLTKRDLQLFLKRYRKNFGVDLTYYICCEHGETTGRSHAHAIFFQDKEISDLNFYANNLFTSSRFAATWKLGNCLISKQVNERSIRYTIAYTLKKLGEEKIVLMSKGIGLDYFKSNKESIKKYSGFYIQNGFKQKPPTYFRRKLKESIYESDIQYLIDKDNEPKPSNCLSGDKLPVLLNKYLDTLKNNELKGKGVF